MNLKELATTLGLSPTTVSRALNGYPEVNAQTRTRVLEAAQRFEYRPNTRAKSLAIGRAMAVGHVIPMTSKHEMMNPIFSDFIAGAGETYGQSGYDMMLSVVDVADEARAYEDMWGRGTIDGVIVHAPRANDPRIPLLQRIGLPFVVHGRSTGVSKPFNWVDVNNRLAFQRATNVLLDLGHRRIGLVNGIETMDFAIRRRIGYLRALHDRGVRADPDLMASDEMTELYGFRAAQRMLALPDPPTAILTASMIPAIGVRRAAEDLGLKLGRDLSVMTHDDDLSYLRNGDNVPIFSATRSSVREAGRLAAQMLLEIVARPQRVPQTRLLEAEVVLGGSTGPCPTRDAA